MPRFRHSLGASGSVLSAKEQALLADTVGAGRYRVVTRWPLTVAFGPHAWLPAFGGGVCGFALSYRHGLWFALVAASVAGAAEMVSLATHEAGHLLSSRVAPGVSPRMLLMRSSGGVAIVEGRFTEPGGAAAFAAGGPIATVVFTIVLVLAAVLVAPSSVSLGLLVAAFLNTLILAVNLLPVAPTDGYALFRSAVWAETGSRAEAECRALAWSRVVLAWGLSVALLVLAVDKLYGVLAVVMLSSLTAQHHLVASRATQNRA
jgi:Zn-dependent protease